MTLTELQKEIYSINKANGWHDKVPSKLEQHALFHTEITEAYNEFIEGRLDTWYQEDGKPEGFYTELADVVIRILDYFSLERYAFENELVEVFDFNKGSKEIFILTLHQLVSLSSEQVRIKRIDMENYGLNKLIWIIDDFLDFNNQSLTDLIIEKIAYNKTRGYRYGNKQI